ncbi:tetratricopeptide repeat-containing sensor histidine kinase [Tenacibaculum sp. nBUS_03]|uniref:tetratricopeptide repeat-containing sensor histidine kinase n=1 Tax=Tenacibaculum sp. nBUS_03 TaxID=3395320 RepID=UPI003EBAB60B
MKSLKKHFFFILILYLNFSYGSQNDSIDVWIKQAKSRKLDKTIRKEILLKAYNHIISNKNELPLKLSSIAYEFYNLKDTVTFFKINRQALKLAQRNNHTYAIGDAQWNYATFYTRIEIFDKAYFHFNEAYQAFTKKGYKKEAAQTLHGMARIKGKYRDYTGSESLNIKVIQLFKELRSYMRLYSAYNHLANLQKDIKEYDRSLFYYNKALQYLNKTKYKKKYYEILLNNIGRVYFKKKNFNKAIEYYNKALEYNYQKENFARIISNRAYCKLFLNDTLGVKNELYKAYFIRDSLKDKTNILASKLYISDYYKYIKDTIKAIQYAKESNLLAKQIKNGGDYLTSLKQLANLDVKNSKKYLDRYIEFNDSLINAERKIQNKFTRIEFETDEYIEETERLSQQRIWIIVTSIGGVLILSLLYFLRVQKVQNEKLSIEAEHQKANEEVYVLTLQQQAKLEEERIKERNRISEELHDGILGKLFGTRFGLGFLPIKGEEQTLEKHQSLLNELQDIEKEIRDVSHKLSDNFSASNINFTSIIKQLLEDKGVIGNFTHTIAFSPDIVWKDINEITKANVYRIIQEALQNIIKHAKAKNVTLDFYLKNKNLVLKIQDDGVGFTSKKGKKGIGLKNIKTRIEKLKGSIEIKSEINVGTTLLINTPYIQKDGKKTINSVNN